MFNKMVKQSVNLSSMIIKGIYIIIIIIYIF